MTDCNQAVEIDRTRRGLFRRGLVYCAQGQYSDAINELNEAVTRKYPKAYRGLAAVYYYMAREEILKAASAKDRDARRGGESERLSPEMHCQRDNIAGRRSPRRADPNSTRPGLRRQRKAGQSLRRSRRSHPR